MTLAQLLAGVDVLPGWSGHGRGPGFGAVGSAAGAIGQLEITSVTPDSRQVRPGTLFVAVRGTQVDGNDFLVAAARAGAAAALSDRPERAGWVEAEDGRRCPVLAVADARQALALVAANLYGRPADRLQVIAVTGTLGKTSTSHLLYGILQRAGRGWNPGLIGSLGIRWDGTHHPSELTTPDAVTLHEDLAAMLAAGVRLPVVEVSSHAQLQSRVAGIRFAAATFLDLVPGEHADIHPDFQHYVQVKARILDELRRGAPLAYNSGDPRIVQLLRGRTGGRPAGAAGNALAAWPFVPIAYDGPDAVSLDVNPWREAGRPAASSGSRWLAAGGRIQLRDVELGSTGSQFRVASAGPIWTMQQAWRDPVNFPCRVGLLGLHNVANALAAATTALVLGVPVDAIQAGLAQAQPFRRRMQVVYRGEFTVIDDTTGHPASFAALFHVVRLWQPRRVLLLTSARGQRGESINRANALAIAAGVRALPVGRLVVSAARDCPDERQRPTEAEMATLVETLQAHEVECDRVDTVAQAVERLLREVRPGDLVLLAGTQNLDQAAAMLRQRLGADDQTPEPTGRRRVQPIAGSGKCDG